MKIGIQMLAYNCAATIDRIIDPWAEMKSVYDLKIWVGSGQFYEYWEMGHPYKNEETLRVLEEELKRGRIDHIYATDPDEPNSDHETRTESLDYFRDNDIDLMILVDADEFYTTADVINLLNYIKSNTEPTWYSIPFKNLIGDGKRYFDFPLPRVVWIKRHGGIRSHYFDNHFTFYEKGYDGLHREYRTFPGHNIDPSVLSPLHYTWTNNMNTTGPDDIRDKIEYQKKFYNDGSSFVYNKENGQVEFNEEFYRERGLQIPVLKYL